MLEFWNVFDCRITSMEPWNEMSGYSDRLENCTRARKEAFDEEIML